MIKEVLGSTANRSEYRSFIMQTTHKAQNKNTLVNLVKRRILDIPLMRFLSFKNLFLPRNWDSRSRYFKHHNINYFCLKSESSSIYFEYYNFYKCQFFCLDYFKAFCQTFHVQALIEAQTHQPLQWHSRT